MKIKSWVGFVVIGVVFAMALSGAGILPLPVDVLPDLAIGWVLFLGRVSPRVTVNVGGVVSGMLCLAGVIVVGQVMGSWLWREMKGEGRWRVRWTLGLVGLVVLLFASGIAVVGVTHQVGWMARSEQRMVGWSSWYANRIRCAGNMRDIGQAIEIYAKAHGGKLPEDLGELLLTTELMPDELVCPDDEVEKAPGKTAEEQVRNLRGHVSSVSRGRGMSWPVGEGTVLLCEPLGYHEGDGMNVLFGDGHVEFLTATEARKVLAGVGE